MTPQYVYFFLCYRVIYKEVANTAMAIHTMLAIHSNTGLKPAHSNQGNVVFFISFFSMTFLYVLVL